MLEFMILMIILDALIKIPDIRQVHELRKAGWKGNLKDYYEWKRN